MELPKGRGSFPVGLYTTVKLIRIFTGFILQCFIYVHKITLKIKIPQVKIKYKQSNCGFFGIFLLATF